MLHYGKRIINFLVEYWPYIGCAAVFGLLIYLFKVI